MSEADREDAQSAWADAVIAGLFAGGVRSVSTSPGSRSTPLVLAAARAGMLGASLIDERTAGFYALGCARVTGEPAALLCTSGSAGAHYLPAVIEASEAGLPLVAITADRPPELHGAAAPQTIDQTRLFGTFARAYADLGPPRASELARRAARRRAAQVVLESRTPVAGPVHINVPADEPLVPEAPRADAATASASDSAPRAPLPPRSLPDPSAITEVAERCRRADRGLIVAGPAPPSAHFAEAAFSLAEATGFPLLAEAASQLRFLGPQTPPHVRDAFDLALSSSELRRRSRPQIAIQLGAPPTSWALRSFLAESPQLERVVVAEGGWPDPESSATQLVRGDVAISAEQLASALRAHPGAPDPELSDTLARGDAIAWRCVEAELGRRNEPFGEGAAARATVGALPEGALLCVGNSRPIRTVDRFCPARASRLAVASQRGANGIDGLLAGASGAASAHDGPTLALIGDVSFAHDVGSLQAAKRVHKPFVVVVIDNGGGRIFDDLPIATHADGADWYDERFVTPPAIAPDVAASAFGLRGVSCASAEELAAAIASALTENGCSVIRADVDSHSASQSVGRIRESIDQIAREELP